MSVIDKTRISCVIHTYNSEKYLIECLESVKWCDEIVIVDMYSTDKTLEIAKEYNCNVYMHENVGYADPARAFGLSKCSNDWILALDSDEIVMPKLKDELINIAKYDKYDVVKISRRNFFFGREILGAGWSYKDDIIPRFFKKGFMTYTNEVHNFTKISPNARIGYIVDKEKSIIHFNYDSVSQFINKLNRYTDFEVNSTKYNYKGKPALKIIYHFFREVLGRFIYKKGYKDGWVGLYLSLAMAFYRASAIAKSNLPTEKKVIDEYKKVANEFLKC
ncbi:glycosyltransferase family 2 protein [Venenivibrio stagnispumantis]|uniref:Glycosyltransferase involved in cell wall bisynthesis n=1 Tax=Venenivibrio stagnispumantis TaxID=407998 RepID=A0AA46AF05_9AQUI|nr:glycosyltransferase family 2 protein [Venenivibrio stagnispumantis]MCW4573209.1 glycosyltransferase family 2 protein [Venenivibrio stagnispumantis]SMP17344.1 Glycosyltransferase involved in cell wall bisynthesis [Venenivibrio stagnispumantis]